MDTTPALPDHLRVTVGDRRRLSVSSTSYNVTGLRPVEVVDDPFYSPSLDGWMVIVRFVDRESIDKRHGTPYLYVVHVSALVN